MQKTFKTRGIVLRKREWRDNDLLFSILTEKYGLVRLLATGVRKPKSKLAGHLAVLGLIDLVFVKGRTFDKLTHAYLINKFEIDSEYDYLYAEAMLEIVYNVLEIGEQNDSAWHLVEKFLPQILKYEKPEEKKLVLNIAIIKLVSSLGYHISDQKLLKEVGLKVNKKLLDFLETMQDNKKLLVLTKKENEQLFRFLNKYLRYFIEKPFKSLELLY